MGFENTTTIAGLNELWPLGTDPRSEGDDHLREIKKVLKTEFPKGGVTNTAQTRNRIVNGAMQVSQENGNTALGPTGVMNSYAADQWLGANAIDGTATQQRVQVTTPNGSVNRIRLTVNTADTSLITTQYQNLLQIIEGIRVADFRYGTASAKQSILRFGWKSPAGTYTAGLFNSAANRSYVANFTISAGQANTDTEQVLVIPGDTTGTWLTDTGIGIGVRFNIGAGPTSSGAAGWQAGNISSITGSTNGLATAGNVFELFDVGLYLDLQNTGVAPAWQMPDEAQELAACQRYWTTMVIEMNGYAGGANYFSMFTPFAVQMRVVPALSSDGNGTPTNLVSATFDSPRVNGYRCLCQASAAGGWAMNARTGKANARM